MGRAVSLVLYRDSDRAKLRSEVRKPLEPSGSGGQKMCTHPVHALVRTACFAACVLGVQSLRPITVRTLSRSVWDVLAPVLHPLGCPVLQTAVPHPWARRHSRVPW